MKTKWIHQALIGSSILNIIFIGLLFYVMYIDRAHVQMLPFRSAQLRIAPVGEEEYDQLKNKSYEELIALLGDTTILKTKYCMQDIALGLLVKDHKIDLQKALGYSPSPRFFFNDALIFPTLKKKEYKQVQAYLQHYEAPFTVQGLFERLPESADLFCQTNLYLQVQTLLCRLATGGCERALLLTLCQEAGWDLLHQLHEEQQQLADYRVERARRFLSDAVNRHSRQAAYILLMTSPQQQLAELEDHTIELILRLVDVKSPAVEACCLHLMNSNRPPVIKDLAKQLVGKQPAAVASLCSCITHSVQPGESLWLIAKKYHTTIQHIQAANPNLPELLRPGMKVMIPQGSGS